MSTLKGAKWVLNDLQKNGFEGFIVGGAVRDYLLREPLNDIDITTIAKPHEVSKIFKTKPTGLKYGTVTVFMHEETFEVTTYRIDGEYQDSRHPESVVFSETVIEDVQRRDFTINGLLMNAKGEIIDYVNGKEDLAKKLIRTIGDPKDRFNEDALRILRAFYFQSKLGFQIEKETRDAISLYKDKLSDIAMERILNELLKILKGKHVRMAFHSMVTTGVHEVLPGLKAGIEYASKMEEFPFIDAFFALAFTLNGSVPKAWPFSNKHRHKYEVASKLAKENDYFDAYTLYTYGLELCTLANKVNYMLGKSKNLKNKIEADFNSLPIQSDLDLKLRATDILKLTDKKAGAWLKNLQTEMVVEVINRRLKNNKESLEQYVLAKLKG
ncbi:MAG: CCA tRNA nucleotidyltransferase [Bacillota bacterium]|nr:MAG: CCA tRNA nucleotidyltransferase [Bacillota bacterium]